MRILVTIDKRTIKRIVTFYKKVHDGKKPSDAWLKNFLKADVPYMYEWQADDSPPQLEDAVVNFS